MADDAKPDRDAARTAAGDGSGAAPRAGAPEPTPQPGAAAATEVERLRGELAAAQDRALRERAELENVKKRVAREKSEALRFASEGLVRDLLPVIDNLQRAVDHAGPSSDGDPIVTGVRMVLKSLIEALERHGVRVVEARGTRFDPTFHEAIGHVESESPPNTVVDEHQRGYLLHDRLLRPALVTVGKGRGERPDGAADVETPGNDG